MKLTLEDKIKIIELRNQGLGYGTIAKQFKVRDSTISNIWYAYELHGMEGIMHPAKNKKNSAELKLEIMNKYKSGKGTINSLSKEYGIPLNTMRTWQKKIVKNIDISVDTRNKHSGRKKDENIDYKERYEILKKYQAFLKAQRERK